MNKKSIIHYMIPAVMVLVLSGCTYNQRWPGYERQVEDQLAQVQQAIGTGVASGEITKSEADHLLGRLDLIRDDYNDAKGEATPRSRWENLLDRLNDLQADVNEELIDADREIVGKFQIEDKLFALQDRINEGIRSDRMTRRQARDLQLRLDAIRSDYLEEEATGRTEAETQDIYDRLEALEADIDVAMGEPSGDPVYGSYPDLGRRIDQLQRRIDGEVASSTLRRSYQARLDAIRSDLDLMGRTGLTVEEKERIHTRLSLLEADLDSRI